MVKNRNTNGGMLGTFMECFGDILIKTNPGRRSFHDALLGLIFSTKTERGLACTLLSSTNNSI